MANVKRALTSGITKTGTAVADVPDVPTIGTATATGLSASVTFTPAVTGGTPTSYTVTSSPGGFTGTGASAPITVSGLADATSYTFTVTATNAAGTSGSSAASNSITAVLPMEGAYDSLGTVTVSTDTSSITFAGIPTGYKHLQIRWLAQTSRGTYGFDDLWVRFNGDTSAVYSNHVMYGNGSTIAAGADASASNINIINSAGSTTSGSWWGPAIVDVLDYANVSKFKTILSLTGVDLNGATVSLPGRCSSQSASYQSLNAINTITITSGASANFKQYSHFALYGVK